jgi:phosphatidylserine/phosphatidylglycerophosphate/cardiolipin synthase-like enzyme
LEKALHATSPDGFPALTATHEAFTHLAHRSKARLIVISPFIDAKGIAWATGLFRATEAKERILILRNVDDLKQYPDHSRDLRTAITELREYRVHHAIGTRVLPIETFHAKIVMADGSAAYVGSANLLGSSFEVALECGFLIEGPAVAQVVDLVEAMLSISQPLLRTD